MAGARAGGQVAELVHQGRNELCGIAIEQVRIELHRDMGEVRPPESASQPAVEDDLDPPRTEPAELAQRPQVGRGEPFEVRTTLAHPMETGYRPDDQGRTLPRDILTHFGDKPVKNVYDFMGALGAFKAGDKVVIQWLRGDQPMQAEATLKGRQ